MELISADEVKKAYKELWPFMMSPLCKDKNYQNETVFMIEGIINQCKRYKQLIFRDQIVDCDNFALSLWAEFCEIWGATEGYNFPCPIGRASGFRFNGENENHTLITFLAREGIYFYEPQLNQLWKADKKKDLIFLVEM